MNIRTSAIKTATSNLLNFVAIKEPTAASYAVTIDSGPLEITLSMAKYFRKFLRL